MIARPVSSPDAEADTVVRRPDRRAGAVIAGPSRPEAFAATAAPEAARPRRPVIPGYEILAELGRGTMGVVYKARHLRLNRLVALKVVLDGGHAHPEDLVRFLGEAEVLARLQHPHVVLIYEMGWYDGRPYLAMELVEGDTLARRWRWAPRRAAELVEALARAVHHAHRRGVIHRDLKPANVLLTADGRPKLTDFGLARRMDAGAGLTESGALMGTPRYMSPEQALCRDVGPLSDVYGLGAILYELLTGRPPFRGDSLLRTLKQVESEPPRLPTRVRPGVPRDLEAVCLKCLQKEPGDRYGSAAELAADLRRFLAGQPVRARPPRPWRRALAWARRHPGATGCCVGAALAAAASCLWSPGGVPVGGLAVALGALAKAAWSWARGRRRGDERRAGRAA
jgi:serine/threonine protein kinase